MTTETIIWIPVAERLPDDDMTVPLALGDGAAPQCAAKGRPRRARTLDVTLDVVAQQALNGVGRGPLRRRLSGSGSRSFSATGSVPASRSARSCSQAAAAATALISGQPPSFTCLIRPSSGDLYRQVHVRRLDAQARAPLDSKMLARLEQLGASCVESHGFSWGRAGSWRRSRTGGAGS